MSTVHGYLGSTLQRTIVDLQIRELTVDIIRAVAKATKTDLDTIAHLVPGVLHSHNYEPTKPIPECICCTRLQYLTGLAERCGAGRKRKRADEYGDGATPQ